LTKVIVKNKMSRFLWFAVYNIFSLGSSVDSCCYTVESQHCKK